MISWVEHEKSFITSGPGKVSENSAFSDEIVPLSLNSSYTPYGMTQLIKIWVQIYGTFGINKCKQTNNLLFDSICSL